MIRTLTLLPALLLLSLAQLQAQDTTAPLLSSISISPGSVDVAGSDQNISVTLVITDDDSGFAFGNVFLYRPDGNFVSSLFISSTYLTSGDNLNGTYVRSLAIPQYAPPGTWELRGYVQDIDGNRRDYGGTNTAFPNPGDENFTVVNTGTVDITGPQLTTMSITPGTIDTGAGAATITLDLTITDDLSGHDFTSISYFDPSSSQSSLFSSASNTNLISGDALNGTYQTTEDMPQGSANGTWTVAPYLRDRVGNATSLFGPPGGTFVVNNGAGGLSGGLADATDATQYTWANTGDEDWFIQGVITNDGIDAAQSGAIADNESSEMETTVSGPGTLTFWWKVDSEIGADLLTVEIPGTSEFDQISGNEDWAEVTLNVPPGSHTVVWNYSKNSSGSDGADAAWVDQVKFLGDSDTEDPVLQRISISPGVADISTGDVDITITIEATDDFDGVFGASACLYDPDDNYYDGNSFNFVSGDPNCSIWETTMTISQSDFIPIDMFNLGTWRVEVEVDSNFNSRLYGEFADPFPIPGAELFIVSDGPVGGDSTAPFLTDIVSIVPDPVDVTGGAQNIVATFTISDDNTGLDYGLILLYSSTGDFVDSQFFDQADRTAGDANNGTYEVTLAVPEYGAPGTWELRFDLYDVAGNNRFYPFETPFPNPGDGEFTVTNPGAADTTDPALTAISISPGTIDTTASQQSIDVSVTVTDDLSGIRWIFLYVYDPADAQQGMLFSSIAGGATTSNTLMKTINIPQGSMPGTWKIGVFLRDMTGNTIRYGIDGTEPYPVPGDEEFTVGTVASTTYENFVSTFGLTGPDALPGANPDKDPFINILELLLGLDPTTPDPGNPLLYSSAETPTELQLNFTIDPSLTVQVNGNFLEVSEGAADPIMVTGQTGANLINDWALQLPANIGGSDYRVSLPFSSGTNGNINLLFPAP